MGPGRSSSLRIGSDSSVTAGSRWAGGASDRSTGVDLRDAPREPPFHLNNGKGRIDEIKYPGGSKYLKSDSCHVRVSGINNILFPMFLLLP